MTLRVADAVLGVLRWDAIFRHILTHDGLKSLVLCRVGSCFQHATGWNDVVESVVIVEAAKVSMSGRGKVVLETRLSIPTAMFA